MPFGRACELFYNQSNLLQLIFEITFGPVILVYENFRIPIAVPLHLLILTIKIFKTLEAFLWAGRFG